MDFYMALLTLKQVSIRAPLARGDPSFTASESLLLVSIRAPLARGDGVSLLCFMYKGKMLSFRESRNLFVKNC